MQLRKVSYPKWNWLQRAGERVHQEECSDLLWQGQATSHHKPRRACLQSGSTFKIFFQPVDPLAAFGHACPGREESLLLQLRQGLGSSGQMRQDVSSAQPAHDFHTESCRPVHAYGRLHFWFQCARMCCRHRRSEQQGGHISIHQHIWALAHMWSALQIGGSCKFSCYAFNVWRKDKIRTTRLELYGLSFFPLNLCSRQKPLWKPGAHPRDRELGSMAPCKKESSGTGDRKSSEEARHCRISIILKLLVFSCLELLDLAAVLCRICQPHANVFFLRMLCRMFALHFCHFFAMRCTWHPKKWCCNRGCSYLLDQDKCGNCKNYVSRWRHKLCVRSRTNIFFPNHADGRWGREAYTSERNHPKIHQR